jgi:hypothetical protein
MTMPSARVAADILKPHGWVHMGSDSRGDGWARPGRTRRGAYTREHGLLTVYADSAKFKAGSYSKFDPYAVLNHDCDRRAAAQALHSQGFGVFRGRDSNGNQIVQCETLNGRRTYSYTWPTGREPLTVGDTVELPPPMSADGRNTYGDQPWQAKVTHMGTYYSGQLFEVTRLVERASQHDSDISDEG